ncbi:MAG: hypothetical protein MUO72_13750 [Bacteroidales bacterium]|nr:hypothetical protein [Bacteroidales bacterium]
MDKFGSHPLYRKHDIDSVLSSIWPFYTKNFVVLFIASFVFSLAYNFLLASFDFMKVYTLTDPMEMLEEMRGWICPMVAIIAASLIFYTIIHYYVIYKPVDSSVNIFVAAYKSLKYLIPYLIIFILFFFFAGAAMIVGLFALIIGIFFSMLYVFMVGLFILPILMVEGTNIGNAIVRTFTLAHRRFWPNLGWTAVYVLIFMVITMVLSTIILLPFSGSFFKILTNPADAGEAMNFMTNPWYIILSALVRALFMPLTPMFAAVLYFNGKAREEDIPSPVSVSNGPDKVRVEDLYAKPYSDDHPENPEK